MGAATNRSALERTLRELRRMGRLEQVDAAVVQAARSMAFMLDLDPSLASLWRQYLVTVREMTADDGDDSAGQALADLFAQMGDATSS